MSTDHPTPTNDTPDDIATSGPEESAAGAGVEQPDPTAATDSAGDASSDATGDAAGHRAAVDDGEAGVTGDEPAAVDDGEPGAAGDEPAAAPPPPPPPAPAAASPPVGQQRPLADPATRRNWAAAAHWSAVATALLGGLAFLGPLVVWLVQRDRDAWVTAHALESLNFQLTWLIGAFVGGIAGALLTVVTVGIALIVLIPLALVLLVAWFVLPIRAAIAASRAEEYRYPLTVRLIQA